MKRRVTPAVIVVSKSLGVRLVVGDQQGRLVGDFLAAGRQYGDVVVAVPPATTPPGAEFVVAVPPAMSFSVDAAPGPGRVDAILLHDPAARAGVRVGGLRYELGVHREQHEHGNDRARYRREPLVGQQALLDLSYSVGAAAVLGHACPVSSAAYRA